MNAIAKAEQSRAVAAHEPASLIEAIARAASDPATDIEKMERLFVMHERMQASQARVSYMAALSQMQADIPDDIPQRGTIKNKAGGIQSRYALWEDINKAIRPIMHRHGFAISFRTEQASGLLTIIGVLSHERGHSESASITVPHDGSGSKNAVQAIGSSVSYGKRYTAGELLNLTSRGEDDDGQAGGTSTITEAQYLELRNMIEASGSDEQRFAEFMRVEHLEMLPAARFEGALAALRQKMAKAKARAE